MSDTILKFGTIVGVLSRLTFHRKTLTVALSEIAYAKAAIGDVPDEVLQPVLTWLGLDHPLQALEKHTRWSGEAEYRSEIRADAEHIATYLPRTKVRSYLRSLDRTKWKDCVDWSLFDDAVDTRVHETADEACSDTARQYEILLWSGNDRAADDADLEFDGLSTGDIVGQMAYYAYRQDLLDAITSITNEELAGLYEFPVS